MEQSKQATLLGMDAQAVTGAQSAVMQGQQMMAQGLGNIVGGATQAWNPTGGADGKGAFEFFK